MRKLIFFHAKWCGPCKRVDDLISVLVCSDAEATKRAVDGFASMFKEAVQAAVVEKLKGGTPKTGGSSASVTKEQIPSYAPVFLQAVRGGRSYGKRYHYNGRYANAAHQSHEKRPF